ncbi:MAG: U32 family peptidase [Candidatus Margulisbacteria bacterium]|nr:U32 family peptidase [Candidatus Margulisiibacteriota bacterium]
MKKPELLAPAGNPEKLKIAYAHGADACYIGGTVFGLRKFADNFSVSEIQAAIDHANTHNKKLYIVLNGFAHNEDIEALKPYLETMEKLHPHGFIISDMGVMQLAKRLTTIDLHTSTQASVTNIYGCELWKNAGAKRIILAREVSIADCKKIKEKLDIELEVFVHGAMCASYSGKCVISNYTSGRDSNRGGCIQSCRHTYDILDETTKTIEDTTHIMNAKDLMAVSLIPQLIESGIDSLKIEGRMKSNLYVANAVSVYRQAIDYYMENTLDQTQKFETELKKVSNRTFSTGGLDHRPAVESIHYDFAGYTKGIDFIGTVKDIHPKKGIILEIKSPFQKTDPLEFLCQNGTLRPIQLDTIWNMADEEIETVNQNTLIRIPANKTIKPYDILRRKIS